MIGDRLADARNDFARFLRSQLDERYWRQGARIKSLLSAITAVAYQAVQAYIGHQKRPSVAAAWQLLRAQWNLLP